MPWIKYIFLLFQIYKDMSDQESGIEMASGGGDMDAEEMISKMRTLNKKFRKSCSQVILLNNQIEYLQSRYDQAVKSNKRSYRYFMRLRLATLEGIRNMFYEYACRRADELDEMQDTLVQEGFIDSDYDMIDGLDSDTEHHPEPPHNSSGDSDLEQSVSENSQQSATSSVSNNSEHRTDSPFSEGASNVSDRSFASHHSHGVSFSMQLHRNIANGRLMGSNDTGIPGTQLEAEQDVVIEGALDTVVMETQANSSCSNIVTNNQPHGSKDSASNISDNEEDMQTL